MYLTIGRCVGAQDPHAFLAGTELTRADLDCDRVAVGDVHDGCVEFRRSATTASPTPPGAPEQGDGQRRAHGSGESHAGNVASGCDTVPGSDAPTGRSAGARGSSRATSVARSARCRARSSAWRGSG